MVSFDSLSIDNNCETEMVGQVGSKNDALDGSPDPLMESGNFLVGGGGGNVECGAVFCMGRMQY